MKEILVTILLSMAPISELRGSIPYALLSGIDPALAFLISVAGNIAIIFVVFFFLDYLHRHFMKIKIYVRLFDWYMERIRKKTSKIISSWVYVSLYFFVAVPLPGTGAYTGCLIAWFFSLNRYISILAIAFGVLTAGIIVIASSLSIINLF